MSAVSGNEIRAWLSGLGAGLGVLACGFEPLWWDKCFAVYVSGGKGGWTCLECRETKFVHGAVG